MHSLAWAICHTAHIIAPFPKRTHLCLRHCVRACAPPNFHLRTSIVWAGACRSIKMLDKMPPNNAFHIHSQRKISYLAAMKISSGAAFSRVVFYEFASLCACEFLIFIPDGGLFERLLRMQVRIHNCVCVCSWALLGMNILKTNKVVARHSFHRHNRRLH